MAIKSALITIMEKAARKAAPRLRRDQLVGIDSERGLGLVDPTLRGAAWVKK